MSSCSVVKQTYEINKEVPKCGTADMSHIKQAWSTLPKIKHQAELKAS